MKLRNAFSMIELIFVIVIMGVIAKFGTEFLAESYKSFIFSKVNNQLQSDSAKSLEFIASRLQYRIKDSIIARKDKNNNKNDYKALAEADDSYQIIEWVSSDMDGYRGIGTPFWSGIIDLKHSDSTDTLLISPETNTTAINKLIEELSYGDSNIADSALYFIGANSDIDGYGWNGTAITTQDKVIHPIKADNNITYFLPRNGETDDTNSFSGIDVYEYYKLVWSANALKLDSNNSLILYYDYQPWNGESYNDGKSAIIVENVSTFRAIAIGSIIKVQVCIESKLVEEYSLCKEKTVF